MVDQQNFNYCIGCDYVFVSQLSLLSGGLLKLVFFCDHVFSFFVVSYYQNNTHFYVYHRVQTSTTTSDPKGTGKVTDSGGERRGGVGLVEAVLRAHFYQRSKFKKEKNYTTTRKPKFRKGFDANPLILYGFN
jgi:hypothetical protein